MTGHRLAGRKVIQSIYYRWDDYASAIVELCKARTANWTQFQLFYERPFIGTSDQLMFPIDKRLLRIMLTEGVYWQVVRDLVPEPVDKAEPVLRWRGRMVCVCAREKCHAARDARPCLA